MSEAVDPADRTTIRLVALLAAGVLVLTAVVGAVAQARDAERAGVTAVDAVVLADAGPERPTAGSARVAWRAGGRTGVATAPVRAGVRPGETVRMWIHRDGSAAPPPDGAGSTPAVVALVAGTATAAAVLAAHRSARSRARSRDLAREWARIEPAWSGR